MTSSQTEPRVIGGLPKVPLFDRTDGSFFKPCPSSTAKHCINFWSNVAIPDEIIRQVEVTYMERRKAEVEAGVAQHLKGWEQAWLNENPKPRFKAEQWESKFQTDRAAVAAEARQSLTEQRPMLLGLYDSRQLVRAAQMLYHAPDSGRFFDEHIAVRDFEVELFRETLTVEQIEDKYRLFDMHYAVERVFADATLTQILQAINDVNSNLSIVSEEVIDARMDSIS